MERYNAQEDHAHCVQVVQQRDREGYVCGLLMPSHARQAYFAIRAFNVEIASIKDVAASRSSTSGNTNNPPPSEGSSLALQMRIQWWRDALEELYAVHEDSEIPRTTTTTKSSLNPLALPSCWHNPIIRSLYYANTNHHHNHNHHTPLLTRRFLERLVEARQHDLTIDQLATMDDALLYAEDTTSSLLYLSLECVGLQNEQADQVASHAGRGIGLTMALRSTIPRLWKGELTIPADAYPGVFPTTYLLQRHAAATASLESPSPSPPYDPDKEDIIRQGFEHVASLASVHLQKAREDQHQIPSSGRSCLLPVVPNLQFLEQLQHYQYDIGTTQQAYDQSKFRTLALIGRAWMTGVF
eukprot:CAMPEP_0195295606 /NCGR_PEP_ID=MMETSP0707-20130614/17690_1 /TAXON_ID=33640 /ORGANISM="Asterionellopsis glacialis, Strain CCMP134" /LENGTH=354 /DNA_ID=CAMNT_0040356865 /DNA_START=274 /DNA_END=1338 /DNA_ORIENTATION=+